MNKRQRKKKIKKQWLPLSRAWEMIAFGTNENMETAKNFKGLVGLFRR